MIFHKKINLKLVTTNSTCLSSLPRFSFVKNMNKQMDVTSTIRFLQHSVDYQENNMQKCQDVKHGGVKGLLLLLINIKLSACYTGILIFLFMVNELFQIH